MEKTQVRRSAKNRQKKIMRDRIISYLEQKKTHQKIAELLGVGIGTVGW